MKRFNLLALGFILCLASFSFATRYALQFKDGQVVEGELIKDDGVQISIKLDSGNTVSYYKVLMKQSEPSVLYHTRLGDDLYKNKKYAQAVQEYELILKAEPKNAYAPKQIAAIEAISKTQESEKLAKQNDLAAALLYSQGMTAFRNGNYELAAQKFQEVLKYNPNDDQAREQLKVATQKSQIVQARDVQQQRDSVEAEKKVTEMTNKEVLENNKVVVPVIPVAPVVPGTPMAGGVVPEGINVSLYSINGTGSDATAVLHVVSGTTDRELRLKLNESQRVGSYRIRATNIDLAQNAVTVDVIQPPASTGSIMTLTPTPYQ